MSNDTDSPDYCEHNLGNLSEIEEEIEIMRQEEKIDRLQKQLAASQEENRLRTKDTADALEAQGRHLDEIEALEDKVAELSKPSPAYAAMKSAIAKILGEMTFGRRYTLCDSEVDDLREVLALANQEHPEK